MTIKVFHSKSQKDVNTNDIYYLHIIYIILFFCFGLADIL